MRASMQLGARAVGEETEPKNALLRDAADFDATRLLLTEVPDIGRLPASADGGWSSAAVYAVAIG